jgi:cytochrome bd-type quinol oxidase subunit 2
MDLRRVRTWEWLTGLSGLVLLVSLFLPWYSAGGSDATAWESFSVVDLIIALAALAALALPVVAAVQRTAAVPQAFASTIIWVLGVAGVLTIVRLLNPPFDDVSREAGVWIAAVASLATIAFDIKSMRDKRFPATMRPRLDIETVPAPLADGTRRDVQ